MQQARINDKSDQFPKRAMKAQASSGVRKQAPSGNFLDFCSLKSPFRGFQVIQTGFQLGKFFFIIKNIFIMKNLTNFHKTVETVVDLRLCSDPQHIVFVPVRKK